MGHATIVGSVRFPGTDSSVLWPPRRTGLARVLMFLRLREREDPRPLELSILSEPDGPRRRRAVLGGDHRELVALELCFRVEALRMLPEWALHGRPRGPRARASFLMPVLRTALFVANELVSRAAGDPRLQRRLADILQDDPQWQKLLAFAETAHEGQLLREVRVVLVDRTLRPAFQAYGVRPLCERGRSADQIYAELLGKQERQVRTDLARHNSATLDQWFDRLLGSEGQTAHDFDLV